ncbi:MAG: hypothetical protein PHC66_01410 [Candidatus Nanoarchaeia archaeon]|nr:hypothetical protein [Candidatus Nanoarchaeia archaeon]MDD5239184.1 hypothetical protein [Candidatus Nanoarchaeia archaeon]
MGIQLETELYRVNPEFEKLGLAIPEVTFRKDDKGDLYIEPNDFQELIDALFALVYTSGYKPDIFCVFERGGYELYSHFSDLYRNKLLGGIEIPKVLVDISAYGHNKKPGTVEMQDLSDVVKKLYGKHVLCLDDCVETGTSYDAYQKEKSKFGLNTLEEKLAVLLIKENERKVNPNFWVIQIKEQPWSWYPREYAGMTEEQIGFKNKSSRKYILPLIEQQRTGAPE